MGEYLRPQSSTLELKKDSTQENSNVHAFIYEGNERGWETVNHILNKCSTKGAQVNAPLSEEEDPLGIVQAAKIWPHCTIQNHYWKKWLEQNSQGLWQKTDRTIQPRKQHLVLFDKEKIQLADFDITEDHIASKN